MFHKKRCHLIIKYQEMHHYVEDLVNQGLLDVSPKLGTDDLHHKINRTTQHPTPNNNAPRVINLNALDKPPTKESHYARKRKVMMINTVTKIDYNPVIALQSTMAASYHSAPRMPKGTHDACKQSNHHA